MWEVGNPWESCTAITYSRDRQDSEKADLSSEYFLSQRADRKTKPWIRFLNAVSAVTGNPRLDLKTKTATKSGLRPSFLVVI